MIDAAIVGGGPAGAAAACELARAGRRVVLLEREPGPAHKMCGEFLGGVALGQLAALGIDVQAFGASPITRMRVLRGRRHIEAALPFRAAGLSRRVLDEALLTRAAALGAEIRRDARVRLADARHVASAEAEWSAGAVLLATGKHDLRSAKRPLRGAPEDLVGFKMHFALTPPERARLDGAVELHLFDDAYAGLQCIEDGAANLCLLADRARLSASGGTWATLLADLCAESAALRARLDGAAPLFERPLTIARVPYGHIHPPVDAADGMFRLGDQMGVIPSFTGEGMAIALHSGRAAARAVLRGLDAAAHHADLRRDMTRQIRLATTLYRVGRSAPGQRLILAAAALWPGLLALVARATRVRALA